MSQGPAKGCLLAIWLNRLWMGLVNRLQSRAQFQALLWRLNTCMSCHLAIQSFLSLRCSRYEGRLTGTNTEALGLLEELMNKTAEHGAWDVARAQNASPYFYYCHH